VRDAGHTLGCVLALTDDEESVNLPRTQAGSPPQHLIVTLLADYSLRSSAMFPSAALVKLAEEFGVSEVGARAALSRLARRGVVVHSKQGRRTSYQLSQSAARVLARGSRRLAMFSLEAEEWDGFWTVVAFSLPEARRDARHLLRSRLRWLGFAPLYDGLWVSPHSSGADVTNAVEGLEVSSITVLRAQDGSPQITGARPPIAAWDLDEIAAGYRAFLDRWYPVVERLREGGVSAGEALVSRTTIMDTYRRFPGADPQLPLRLMPAGWPRAEARDLFVEAYDWLGPLAELRVRQVVAEHDPELAAAVTHHDSRDLVEAFNDR
jgi:phenylacetic acid degradation operon negative regulatory protein